MNEDIISFPPYRADTPLFITFAGITYRDGKYRHARRKTEITVFEYIIKGRGTLCVDATLCHPEAGDVYIVPAGTDHYYYSDAKDPWEKIWFNVGGSLVPTLLAAYGLAGVLLLKNCPLKDYFEENLAKLRKPGKDMAELSMEIIGPLIAMLGNFNSPADEKSSEAASMLKLIHERIYDKTIPLADFCKVSGKSESQSMRIFKKEFGMTPYAYFLHCKMEKAEGLLKNSALPIKEIALQLGFEDPYYFSNLFKRKTGKSPSACRLG